MNFKEFQASAHELVDWMTNHLENIESLNIQPNIPSNNVYNQLRNILPSEQETFKKVFEDLKRIFTPAMPQWKHTAFFGSFPANSNLQSLLKEMLIATLGTQYHNWQNSQAADELEIQVMEWLQQMMGLPEYFTGVILESSFTSTLCAALSAREMASNYTINSVGFSNQKFASYCSKEAYPWVEKAIAVAGLGKDHLKKIAIDHAFSMKPHELENSIKEDISKGINPLLVVATIGTMHSAAIDPLKSIAAICKKYNLWLHIDATYAGAVMILPDMRWIFENIEEADSITFNLDNWMFTNFDCSVYFVRNKAALLKTFEVIPQHLKTHNRANSFGYTGILSERRFEALKLWFMIKHVGVNDLQEKIRFQLQLTKELEEKINNSDDFEIMAPIPLNLICFRFKPLYIDDEDYLNVINEILLEDLNKSGKLFLTITRLNGKCTLRLVIGPTSLEKEHINEAWELIQKTARQLTLNFN